jgi:hypothetical protein
MISESSPDFDWELLNSKFKTEMKKALETNEKPYLHKTWLPGIVEIYKIAATYA